MNNLAKELIRASLRGVTVGQMDLYCVVSFICLIIGIALLGMGDPREGFLIIIISIVIFIYLFVARRYVEDSRKMNLQFRLPSSEEKLFVNRQMQKIANAYEKENSSLVCFLVYIGVSVLMMILCKGMIGKVELITLLVYIFLPGVFAVVAAYVLFRGMNKSKLEMIERGEYCLAEVVVDNKYTVSSHGRRGTRVYYFAIFSDSAGVQGKFVLPPHVFDMLYEGDVIHLVEWNNGKGFYNDMEPVTILNSIDRLEY